MGLINCFARALNEPETDQERADVNGYNVIEIDPQRGGRPTRVAEPRTGKKNSPYPLEDHFFRQKIEKDNFNVSFCFSLFFSQFTFFDSFPENQFHMSKKLLVR